MSEQCKAMTTSWDAPRRCTKRTNHPSGYCQFHRSNYLDAIRSENKKTGDSQDVE